MGYFSNGSEGLGYEEAYCEKCSHFDPEGAMCPVMALHWDWNYEQHSNPDKARALNILIPRENEGATNGRCRMFIAKQQQQE